MLAVEIADPYAVVFLAGGLTAALTATGWMIRSMIRQTELNTELAVTVRGVVEDQMEMKKDLHSHKGEMYRRLREVEARHWSPDVG